MQKKKNVFVPLIDVPGYIVKRANKKNKKIRTTDIFSYVAVNRKGI